MTQDYYYPQEAVSNFTRLTDDQYAMDYKSDNVLTLRSLISTREAGIIIGKEGKNVSDIREATNVRAGVSKAIEGVIDRVLTVSGEVKQVGQAYGMIADMLIANPRDTHSNYVSVRLLISHHLMGTIIGKQGASIKRIQDASGCRMTASKDMLPQSTERIVELQGSSSCIRIAVEEIAAAMMEEWERNIGTVLYNPAVRLNRYDRRERRDQREQRIPGDWQTKELGVPPDMVGCLIGRGGDRINEIRRISGSRISISKYTDKETGDRILSIQGTEESNEKAIALLQEAIDQETQRRGQEQ